MTKPDLGQTLGAGGDREIFIDEMTVEAMVQVLRQTWQEYPDHREALVGVPAVGAGLVFGEETKTGRAAELLLQATERLFNSDNQTDNLIGLNIGMWLEQGQEVKHQSI